ncbi:MAG: lamin tail domain-containing protein [Gammaproteobacteria bacterium]|nr:lamin tail domain-containing protein [Gammaproteobacteria bacterium]
MQHHLNRFLTRRLAGFSAHRQRVKCLAGIALFLLSTSAFAQDLTITGVVDGPLTGGIPKAVEIYVISDVTDLSNCGVGSANNGGGSDGEEFTFPAVAAVAGSFIYVATETTAFNDFFGFSPDYTSDAASINGDDAIELFCGGLVIDVFGDINVDGTGQPWEYLDGWAYRVNSSGPDGSTFNISNWTFSGANALDGETSNDTAAIPFPIGTYIGGPGGDSAPIVLSTSPANGDSGVALDASIDIVFSEDVTVSGAWFDINCSSSGNHGAVVSGGPQSYTLDPDTDFVADEDCTVDVFAALVTDVDSEDPPDNMAADFQFSFDTNVVEPVNLVINEIHADPDGSLDGDANGDGTRDATDDEFVEIVNNDVVDLDISGWTLADSRSVRHTFPAGTVVAQGCSIVVFGGGTPTGSFGKSLVQTASSGALGLNNGGDSVILNDGANDVVITGYGSDGGDNQSLTLDPDVIGSEPRVKHSLATGSGGALFSPGTKIDGSQFEGCPSTWVINEIHADPDGSLDGDANGDGTRDATDDEFVEIVNGADSDLDISGWTLADSRSVRHTFPAGTMVARGCSIVVFGGGTPTGSFGNSLVQTASSGSLGFNNGGDSVILNDGAEDVVATGYGSEGGDNQSLTLDPDVFGIEPRVKHSVATGSGGALFSPGTKIDGSQFDGCPVSAEIFEIQGSGATSPLAGKLVSTTDNIVTLVGTDGFFIQTPDARDDADVNTSNGIFVYTGGSPTVAVGDQVDVAGNVAEFFDFTEFSIGSTVNVDSSGNPLPAVTVFDDTVPSPDPMAPSCAIEFECYEGMLVQITGGTVTGPNQRFGSDPLAEVHITAAGERTYREPGIEFPGLAGYPEWDGNPEVFEMDPDKLGLPNEVIPAGSSFDATGAIAYEFGDYELWPSELTVTPAPLPVPVRSREVAEMTVGALNLFRLFDDIDDAPIEVRDPDTDELIKTTDDAVLDTLEYERRLAKFTGYICNVLDAPDVLAVSEVESLKVLQDLANSIAADDCAVDYTPYLLEGNDVGGIDVGFLVRETVMVDAVTQLGRFEILSFDGSLLNDRPPLLLEGRQVADGSDFPLAVMAIHGRSLGGIDDSGSNGERVRQKRYEQAQFVAQQVQMLQVANPDINLVVAGDFNAFEFSDSYVDVTGIMKGDFTASEDLICETNPCTDQVNPDLLNQVLMIDAGERYSFIFQGNAQTLDHALTSSGLDELVRDFQFGRGNSDAAVDLINDANTPLRSSDHDGLVLFLAKDSDGDGVTDEADYCPGTVIPEAVPTIVLRTNRFALTDDDRIFDTTEPNGTGPQASFDIFDTAGCSCEQIVVEQGLGKGHLKFGCSLGEMEEWVELINLP